MDSIEYADPETINGLNLYAYCGNNPVMYTQRPVFGGNISYLSVGGSTDIDGSLGEGSRENSSALGWLSTAVGAIPDFILGMRYLVATGMHSKFAYSTNTRYIFNHPKSATRYQILKLENQLNNKKMLWTICAL